MQQQTKPPFAWQQLTELVAAAVGVPLVWHECLDEYSDKRNGAAFDPVRETKHAERLAVERGLTVHVKTGFTVASFPLEGGEGMAAEYDQLNGGDSDKSYRLAVCRAILLQHEVMKS